MQLSDNTARWLKVVLGAFMILYALNRFFHIIPMSYGQMPEEAQDFIDSVAIFLPVLYIFEIIVGLFLVFNKWTSIILIALFPLSVSFLIFHLMNFDLSEMWPALLVAGLNIILLLNAKEKYVPLFD